MSDSESTGPFHLSVVADVRVTDPRRLGGAGGSQLADLLTGLIQRHAWEAGLEIVDPASVHVEVTPRSADAAGPRS